MRVILALLLLPLLGVTSACTCIDRPLREEICGTPNNKFLIKCRVLSEPPPTIRNNDVHYRVNILDVVYTGDSFKTQRFSLTAGSNVTLCTPGNDGICRSKLYLNEDYYLAGVLDVDTRKLRIQHCDFRKKPNQLKQQCQKSMIQNKDFGCNCAGSMCDNYC